MVCEDTLRIKHLPSELRDAEKEDLLRHFGAQKVKIITSSAKQKCVAFAQFESKEIAKSVLIRLHQIKILNSRLCVEFAENDIVPGRPRLKTVENIKNEKTNFKHFINKLTAFNSSVSFNQPPPNHLRYVYPKPNRATINNIAHALASVPKFYTQVLHLMNRMNLPPPFSDIPDPPQVSLRPQTPQAIPVPKISPQPKESTSESELESDEESNNPKEIIPEKRTLPHKKRVKRPKFIKPNPAAPASQKTGDKVDEVFEKTEIQSRKIELKVSTTNLEDPPKVAESTEAMEVEEEVSSDQQKQENDVITQEELTTNQIPLKDLSVLPVFKDYHPGAATNRLYIKNIAKTVEVKDLEYIYKRYIDVENPESAKDFDIRLMQEGRMKGQSFITLPSVALAQQAVKETNGFILKDKPLVVVFAKSVAPKK